MKPTLLIIDEKRDYKAEYKKYGSSTKAKKYRAELNQYNRKKGTYGNGDGKDASHKGGKIVGFESQSKNRGRAEKSRLKSEVLSRGGAIELFGHAKYLGQGIKDMTKAYKKKDWAQMEEEVDYIVTKAKLMGDIVKQKRYQESVNEAKIAHSKGGYVEVGKWYLLNYGKWKDTVKVVSIDAKGMKVYNPNDNWRYTIPMTMIKKKKIGGYMTPIEESVNEDVKTHTIQGNKRWMIKTALPILKKYGIKKVKVNNVGKTNFFYFKITFDTDSNTLKKLDGELKRKNKKSNNYSGIVETLNDSVNEAGGVVTAWIQQKPKGYWAVFNKKGQSQFEGNKKFMINILKKASTLSPNAIGSILDRARFGDKHLEFKAQFSRYYFNESVKVFESTKEYEKSLDKIANDKTLKMMSKKDRDTLKKIADLIKKNRGK